MKQMTTDEMFRRAAITILALSEDDPQLRPQDLKSLRQTVADATGCLGLLAQFQTGSEGDADTCSIFVETRMTRQLFSLPRVTFSTRCHSSSAERVHAFVALVTKVSNRYGFLMQTLENVTIIEA